MTTTLKEFCTGIDGPMLRAQRTVLCELIMSHRQKRNQITLDATRNIEQCNAHDVLTEDQLELLDGLQCLLDSLADICHDQFGIQCLMVDAEG